MRAAVERANSPTVWTAALRQGDPTPLAAAWTGDALTYFSGEILAYRARGLRLVSELVWLEVLEVHLLDTAHARARTREQWRDWLCAVAGEPRGRRAPLVEDTYTLVRTAAGWRVSGVDITLLAGSFEWEPPAPEEPHPCPAPDAAPALSPRLAWQETRSWPPRCCPPRS